MTSDSDRECDGWTCVCDCAGAGTEADADADTACTLVTAVGETMSAVEEEDGGVEGDTAFSSLFCSTAKAVVG